MKRYGFFLALSVLAAGFLQAEDFLLTVPGSYYIVPAPQTAPTAAPRTALRTAPAPTAQIYVVEPHYEPLPRQTARIEPQQPLAAPSGYSRYEVTDNGWRFTITTEEKYETRSYVPQYEEPQVARIVDANYAVRDDGTILLTTLYSDGVKGVFLLTLPVDSRRLSDSYYKVTYRDVQTDRFSQVQKPVTFDVFGDGRKTIYEIVIYADGSTPVKLKLR